MVSFGGDGNCCTQKDMIEILKISNSKNRNTMVMPRPINSNPKYMLLLIGAISFVFLDFSKLLL